MFWMRTAFYMYKFQFTYPIFILMTFPERWKTLIINKTITIRSSAVDGRLWKNAWIRSSCRDMMQSVVNVKLACGVVVGKIRSTFRNNENNCFSKWYPRCKNVAYAFKIYLKCRWVVCLPTNTRFDSLYFITSLFNDLLNKIFFTYYFHDFPKQDQSLYLCIC
jgi:hypothetical protein